MTQSDNPFAKYLYKYVYSFFFCLTLKCSELDNIDVEYQNVDGTLKSIRESLAACSEEPQCQAMDSMLTSIFANKDLLEAKIGRKWYL
jgi:hypothetical protein